MLLVICNSRIQIYPALGRGLRLKKTEKMTSSLAEEMLDEFGRPTKQAPIKSSHRNPRKKQRVTATNGVPSDPDDGDFTGTESDCESSEDDNGGTLPTNVEVNFLTPD